MNKFNTTFNAYQLVLPLDTQILIPDNSRVRTVDSVIHQLDLKALVGKWCQRERDIPFIILLKVVAFGFVSNIRSSRKIERACRKDIDFMWLLQGHRVPDHNMIARFIAAVDMNEVLVHLNKFLIKHEEINFENTFIDGTKQEAYANRYTFVWKGSAEKHKAKLEEKVKVFLAEIFERYKIKFTDISSVVNYFESLNIVRAEKGKRKNQEQKDADIAIDYNNRLNKHNEYLSQMTNRRSLSKTDPDATFMRMKDDHMLNGQLKPAYNVQLAVESEYILGFYVSANCSDNTTLIPFLDKLQNEYHRKPKKVTTDAGYESEENYNYLKEHEINCYIKPTNYEQSKTRKYKKQIGRKENMPYDSEKDEYTCAAGKKLTAIETKIRESSTGYKSQVTIYQCENCTDCPQRSACTKGKEGYNKKIECSRKFEELRAKSLANITSKEGIVLRINRSIQVEGAIGVVKEDYGFRRFTRRGTKQVCNETALICIGYNLNKLHNNIISNSLGFKLHNLDTA